MNPLDDEELKAFSQIIKKDMPIHTDNTAKIKRSFSQGMPKNLMDYSAKVDNKFLNDNLHSIEEMEYRKKGITDNFKNYQKKYYDEFGILNHDLYFEHENKIYPKISGACGLIINPYMFESNIGTEIIVGGNDYNVPNAQNLIMATLKTGVTANKLYNQIGVSVATASGSIRLASYTNGATIPSALYSETASTTTAIGFPYISCPEYTLTQTSIWLAQNNNSATCTPHFIDSGNRSYKSFTFGAFPSSYTQTGNDAYSFFMKTNHT